MKICEKKFQIIIFVFPYFVWPNMMKFFNSCSITILLHEKLSVIELNIMYKSLFNQISVFLINWIDKKMKNATLFL
jgi:hypothetical protein